MASQDIEGREVLIADEAGACYGVERALKMAKETAEKAEGPVHTLGPLIHNPVVVSELTEKGVTVVEDPAVGPKATLLLRTHGVTPEVEEAARQSGAEVLDATCPFVKKVHKAVERLDHEGYQVIIVGEQGHPEVEGTLGHAPEALVVASAEDLDGVLIRHRVGVVVQTTMAKAVLDQVVNALTDRADEVLVLNTICSATSKRQSAAATLAQEVELMLVIGGRSSANTTHLAQICSEVCANTHHIETAGELDPSWFEGINRVGVTAGASTPRTQIDEVVTAVKQLG